MPLRLSRLVLAFVLTALALTPLQAAERPNVLFIAVDDLNDWVGCLGGHPGCQTPNIDRLAARGTLFTRAYCAAPSCNPSRAALMTGRRPSTSGVYVNSQPWRPAMPDAVTIPQHFMQNGYEAVGGGKIFHGGYDDPKSWNDYLYKKGDPKPKAEVLRSPRSRSGGIVWGALDVPDNAMDDYRVVSWAAEYLSQPHDKPFFLAAGIFKPHMPWQVPRKYYEMYPLDKIEVPKVLKTDLDDVPRAGRRMAKPEGDHRTMVETGNWKYAVQAYLASITFADVQIGRLLDALDAGPHAKSTIVVLWGDHGWHLGEKLHWRKFTLWEEACRAPLLIAAPGVTKPGSVCERTVEFVGIYPTLVELCGLPPRDDLDGQSFLALLRDPQAEWDRPALTTWGRNNHAVRSERWRYIRYEDGTEELYDHQSDPLEWTNRVADPQNESVKAELAAWLPKTNAPDVPHDRDKAKENRKKRRNQAADDE